MNLYQVHQQIADLLENGFDMECIDMQTGEILEDVARERLASLEIEEGVKIENTALFIKNLVAEVDAIKAEEKTLADRRKSKERKYEWLKAYVGNYLLETGKTKFETARCALSFRKSEVLNITDEETLRKYAEEHDYLKIKEPELKKDEIKKALKGGEAIPGAEIMEKQNLQIK